MVTFISRSSSFLSCLHNHNTSRDHPSRKCKQRLPPHIRNTESNTVLFLVRYRKVQKCFGFTWEKNLKLSHKYEKICHNYKILSPNYDIFSRNYEIFFHNSEHFSNYEIRTLIVTSFLVIMRSYLVIMAFYLIYEILLNNYEIN